MPSLHRLQAHMMQALLDGESESEAASMRLVTGGIAPLERLAVYRNNIEINFAASLRASFPAIWRLVGEDYFLQCARQFQRSQPSRSGDLQHVGAGFSEYLAALHADDEFRYLGDVARLEWLCQGSLLAANHAPLDLQKLAGVAASQYDTLSFRLHPTARLFVSDYPCLNIWEANAHETSATDEVIELGVGAERVLIYRNQLQLQFYRLSIGELGFLRAVEAGAGFASAIEAGGACDVKFDAGSVLQRLVAMQVIVDC